MVTQGRLMDHSQLLSNCLPQAALALPFLVLQKPCKEVPETSSTISLQALGWRSFLTLEFSEVWKHGNFLMTGSTIDLEILKYFFLLLLEIYACFWDLSCSLWTLRQSIHLNFFFASFGSKFPLPFLWPLVLYVLKKVSFVSTSYIIYLVFILHLCLFFFLFFILPWFSSVTVKDLLHLYFTSCLNAPSLPLNDLPNTYFLSPHFLLLPCLGIYYHALPIGWQSLTLLFHFFLLPAILLLYPPVILAIISQPPKTIVVWDDLLLPLQQALVRHRRPAHPFLLSSYNKQPS